MYLLLNEELMRSASQSMIRHEVREPKVADIGNAYLGQVDLIINPENKLVQKRLNEIEIARGVIGIRSIMFSLDGKNARDLFDSSLSYRVDGFESSNSQFPSFKVEQIFNMRKLLEMGDLLQDQVFSQKLNEREKHLLEDRKFNTQLTLDDLNRARNLFLNLRNLYKLSRLFGYTQEGACRGNYIKNNVGPLFPEDYFQELTPDEVINRLHNLCHLPNEITEYEKSVVYGKRSNG